MAFDTFDEGVAPGGIRNKNEIRVLICYVFNSVKENMDKDLVVEALREDELVNYFEAAAVFDELVNNGILKESEIVDNKQTYELSENGKMIADQLETTLSYTARNKACVCAIRLLGEKKKQRENSVEIVKNYNGYDIICKISGGSLNLLTFSLFAPTYQQALIMKKNFYESPTAVYKVMLALMTNDKESVGEALEALYGLAL